MNFIEALKKAKKIKNVKTETINKRVGQMLELRDKYLEDIDNVHIKLQQGNSKTGRSVYTVSLIPIADCGHNCKECKKQCYDIINVCYQPGVQNDRARNSAVHKADIERFWNEVDYGIKYNCVSLIRLNVGGDVCAADLPYINKVAKNNPKCDILFFTKSYEEVNEYLQNDKFEENVHCIFSAWENTEMENTHNLPVSHVLYTDGRTTAPEYGSYFCQGNCSACKYNDEGCWTLKPGESVVFPAH